jgi:hypothetical protein
MYTDAMRRAFRSIEGPPGFEMQIMDNEQFLSVIVTEDQFMRLRTVEEKRIAVEYMIRVKKALEDNGAIVLLVREGGKNG